jgi:hypothetical protein
MSSPFFVMIVIGFSSHQVTLLLGTSHIAVEIIVLLLICGVDGVYMVFLAIHAPCAELVVLLL